MFKKTNAVSILMILNVSLVCMHDKFVKKAKDSGNHITELTWGPRNIFKTAVNLFWINQAFADKLINVSFGNI